MISILKIYFLIYFFRNLTIKWIPYINIKVISYSSFFAIFFSLSQISFAQDVKNFRISALGEISKFNNNNLTSYGVGIEYFVNKNLSLDYLYSFGINQRHHNYFHFPGSVAGLVEVMKNDSYVLINSNSNEEISYILFLTFIIPEGISYHFYPRKWLEIAPFLHPFAADYNILDNYHSTITISIGLKCYIKPVKNFSISPHFGLKQIYKNGNVGTFFGISTGILF